VASKVTIEGGKLTSLTARGIEKLKVRETLTEYISKFMYERGAIEFTLNYRGDDCYTASPIVFESIEPNTLVSYTFLEFKLSDIAFHGKELSKAELIRDFKFLKKLLFKESK
jgi:hypothetical protein